MSSLIESEMRKDYLLEEWTIFAPGRDKRPRDGEERKGVKGKVFDRGCPFCPGNEEETPPEISRKEYNGQWRKRVVPNKFAAVQQLEWFSIEKKGLLEWAEAAGMHEVVVETEVHSKKLHELSEEEFTELIDVYAERMEALRRLENAKYVLVLKNHGRECGASLTHEHSQIVTLPITPPRIEMERGAAKKFYSRKKRCVFCEIAKEEGKSERGIMENKGFAAIAPFASKWPYECWVLSKKHFSSLLEFGEKEKQLLGEAMKAVLQAYDELFDDPPYNLVFHQGMKKEKSYHFHVEFYPNIKKIYGGIEKGAGVILNEVFPEAAAAEMRGKTNKYSNELGLLDA